MRITLQQFFQKPVTVHYPHQTLPIPKRFRGHVVLLRDPATGQALCIACKACQKACPSDCIAVDGIKREGEKRKSVTDFKLDFTKCSLCGSCVEVCPVDALEFSRAYNLASTSREAFHQIDLVRQSEPSPDRPDAQAAPAAPAPAIHPPQPDPSNREAPPP